MYRYISAVSLMAILIVSCCGCWNLAEVNNTAVVSGWGADVLDDGQIHFAVQVETASAAAEDESAKPENTVLTSTGRTMTEAARNITLIMPRIPLWAHADSLIIGEQLARGDLSRVADFLARNRNIRMYSTMLVAKNAKPDQVFSINNPLTGCSARCLKDLLAFEETTRGSYVPVTIANFLFKLATPGIDPILPMLTVAASPSGPVLKLQGTALFKDRHMAGTLNERESRGFRWLCPVKNRGGLLVISMPQGKGRIAFETVRFSCKQIPRFQNGLAVMDIGINAVLNVYEQQGDNNLIRLYQRQNLEIAAAREIRAEVQACIDKAQSLDSDILGWGRIIYLHYPRQWEKMQGDWEQLYPQVKANIKVNCRINKTYLSIRPFKFK